MKRFMQHDQEGFYSIMQGWFNTLKAISIPQLMKYKTSEIWQIQYIIVSIA